MRRIILGIPFKNFFGMGRFRLRNNKLFILFAAVLFCGIVFGAVSGAGADRSMLNRLDFIFLTNFKMRSTQGMLPAFVASFASSVMFLFVIFLLGLSLWGSIFPAAVPFFKGYGYGLSVGFLYGAYGFQGILYNVLVILPGTFISSAAVAAAAQLASKNSFGMMRCFMKVPARDDPTRMMKVYFLSILRCLAWCAVSALADMLFAACFSWLFNF